MRTARRERKATRETGERGATRGRRATEDVPDTRALKVTRERRATRAIRDVPDRRARGAETVARVTRATKATRESADAPVIKALPAAKERRVTRVTRARGESAANGPRSWPIVDEPARSVPPARRSFGFVAAAAISARPMRPAAPAMAMESVMRGSFGPRRAR